MRAGGGIGESVSRFFMLSSKAFLSYNNIGSTDMTYNFKFIGESGGLRVECQIAN